MRVRLSRVCGAFALVLGGAAGLPAASLGVDPGDRADELRRANEGIAREQRAAAVELFAIESRLDRARAGLAGLRVRAEALETELESTRARLTSARLTLTAAEHLLAERLRALYEQGEVDPVAVLLGARSLEEALDGLDSLRLAAEQDRQILQRSLAAKRRLARARSALERRRDELAALQAQAASRVSELAEAGAERRSYLAGLREQQGLNSRRIATLQAEAAEARRRAQRAAVPAAIVTPSPPAPAAPVPGNAEPGRTLTVIATGYALPGRTATGLAVGWGVVAVDPTVIPLGTRMAIPGYGEGVAADTGPAVRGATIDVWFPTRKQALAWGTRTVTITLHS